MRMKQHQRLKILKAPQVYIPSPISRDQARVAENG